MVLNERPDKVKRHRVEHEHSLSFRSWVFIWMIVVSAVPGCQDMTIAVLEGLAKR